MAAAGILRLDLVIFFSMLGNFTADTFWYLLGYLGGQRRVLLRIRWVRVRWRTIQPAGAGDAWAGDADVSAHQALPGAADDSRC